MEKMITRTTSGRSLVIDITHLPKSHEKFYISFSYQQSGQSVSLSGSGSQEDLIEVDVATNPDFEGSSDLLCLSPSRLIVAFGVLLVVLLLALVAGTAVNQLKDFSAKCTLYIRPGEIPKIFRNSTLKP